MGELGALFNPGMRHELEERQAKASRREEEGNARDGDLRIDLESGVAVINVAGEEAGESDSETSRAESDSASAADGNTSTEDAVAGFPNGDDQVVDQVADDAAADAEAAAGAAAVTVAPGRPSTPAVKPRGKRGLSHSTR